MSWQDDPIVEAPKEDWKNDPVVEGPSVSGFGKNALEDVVGTAKSLGQGAVGMVTHPIDTEVNALKALPSSLIDESKRTGIGPQAILHPIDSAKKLAGAFYDKPLTTSLDVAPFLGLGGEGAMAEKTAPVAETPPPNSPSPTPEPVSTPPNPSLASFKNKIPKEVLEPAEAVKRYLSKEYGEISKKPGMANTAADYLKEHSQNMTLKELGAAPGQVRKIGVEQAHSLADYANENGLVGPKIGTIGREKVIPQRLEQAGGAVGAFRKMASDRGAVHNIPELIDQVKTNLDPKYLTKGMYSGQKGSYLKALDELKKTDGTAQAMSDKITEMFKEAKNQNPLGKPTGPLADVAHQVRNINHDLIMKHLKPEEIPLYERSLEDYGALTQINEFVKRRGSTEAGGRLGPGSGISRAAVQKFLDSFGYRAEAKIAGKLSDFIRKNPDLLSRPRDLFRSYVDEAAEAVHELGEHQ